MKKSVFKKIAATAMMLFMVCGMANAQIVVMDDEEEFSQRSSRDASNVTILIPDQGLTIDQNAYAPVGEGVLLLAGLAGAYALAKRRKK